MVQVLMPSIEIATGCSACSEEQACCEVLPNSMSED